MTAWPRCLSTATALGAILAAAHSLPASADGKTQASFYSKPQRVACRGLGPFNPKAMTTAAHPRLKLECGAWIEVSRAGRSVVVRVTDRGPWGRPERSLDLARAAARAIGITGVATVTWRRVPAPESRTDSKRLDPSQSESLPSFNELFGGCRWTPPILPC